MDDFARSLDPLICLEPPFTGDRSGFLAPPASVNPPISVDPPASVDPPISVNPPDSLGPSSSFDPNASDGELLARLCELAAGIDVGTARMLALVGEVDAREAWAGQGIKSCAHWLSWKCGIGTVTARTHVRVARALRTLPLVRAAIPRRAAVVCEGPRDHPYRRRRQRGRPAHPGPGQHRRPIRTDRAGLAAR